MPVVETSTPDASRYELTRLEFRRRFTIEEHVAIETAAETDPTLRVFQKDLEMATSVRLDDPLTVEGMEYLVAQGHLTEARKTEILTP